MDGSPTRVALARLLSNLVGELGPIALAEAVRRTTEQQATLGATRSSAGTILSASTIGSAFLAGVALDGQNGLTGLGWVAIVATATTAILAMLTLAPVTLGIATSPDVLDRPEWRARRRTARPSN